MYSVQIKSRELNRVFKPEFMGSVAVTTFKDSQIKGFTA